MSLRTALRLSITTLQRVVVTPVVQHFLVTQDGLIIQVQQPATLQAILTQDGLVLLSQDGQALASQTPGELSALVVQ